MKVAILGRTTWDWGPGDVVVIQVGDEYYAQCEGSDDPIDADKIEPELAADLLTRQHVRLTHAGHAWMREQRDLWTKYQLAERKWTGQLPSSTPATDAGSSSRT